MKADLNAVKNLERELTEWHDLAPDGTEDQKKAFLEEKVKENMPRYCDLSGVPCEEDVRKFRLCKWADADELIKKKWINYVLNLMPAVQIDWRKRATQSKYLVSDYCTYSDEAFVAHLINVKLFQWVKEWRLGILPRRGRSGGDQLPSSDLDKFNKLYEHMREISEEGNYATEWEEAARDQAKEVGIDNGTGNDGTKTKLQIDESKRKAMKRRQPTHVMQDNGRRVRRPRSLSPVGDRTADNCRPNGGQPNRQQII